MAGAQQLAGYAGAPPLTAVDGHRAGPPGDPPGAPARRAPKALRLPAAAFRPASGPGLPLGVGGLGGSAWGSLVGRLGRGNAFCNPDCEGVGVWDHKVPKEVRSPWLQNFYDGLDVWVASPYGLAGPYKLRYCRAQGDSQGVGVLLQDVGEMDGVLRHTVRKGL